MRLVLYDDKHILCEAFAAALKARGYRALAIAADAADDGAAAVARHPAEGCPPDVCLHRGADGPGAAQASWDRHPDTTVQVVSGLSERAASSVATKVRAGDSLADDQKPCRMTALLNVIAADRLGPPAGSPPGPGPGSGPPDAKDPLSTLTPRETEVLERIAAGQNTRKMASEMNVTTGTLRTYVKNVLAKLAVHSRLEAAALASGLILSGPDEPDHDHPLFAALTPREREVLTRLTAGSEPCEVAAQLHISLKTANTHLYHLRAKLGVHSTLEAVALARAALGQRAARQDLDCPAHGAPTTFHADRQRLTLYAVLVVKDPD